MRVFVTGGSGFIGAALVPQLVAAGHEVTAIARSDKSAAKLKEWGASTVVKGDIDNLQLLSAEAKKVDGVIHMAFDHDLLANGQAMAACEKDQAAIKALCEGLLTGSGKEKTFISTSGLLGLTRSDESGVLAPNDHMPRYLSDQLALSYNDKGIRALILRPSPVVHGPGHEHMFVTGQIAAAKKSGYVGYVGEGTNLWSSVHVKDCAALYVLALEKAPAGVSLHAAAEEGIYTKAIAEFVAKKMGLPVKSVKKEDAMAHFGWLGMIMQLGDKVTTEKTREWTGWNPTEYGLFEELENYSY
jgi:nucleoside-diphosphate-sugar epimerase